MNTRKLFSLIVSFFCIMKLSAATFTYNGINYELNDQTFTASVVRGYYSGDIVIPSNITKTYIYTVTSIGRNAFEGCTYLKSVSIANTVTSIGDYAFQNCTMLSSIIVPNNVTKIGYNSFRGCTGLTTVSLGTSVTTIDEFAFFDCRALTSITFPNSVTSIGRWAFYGCDALTNVVIPSSVVSVGGGAFSRCLSISVDSKNKNLDSRNHCNAIIETGSNKLLVGCANTIIPDDISSIGNYAFDGCIGMVNINIPTSVTTIGISAFEGCAGLKTIIIPGNVNKVDQWAFRDCTSLESVVIKKGVTSIYQYAFNGCSSLLSVTIEIDTPPSISTGTFSNSSNATLYVPVGSKSAYEAATCWQDFKEIVEMADEITIGAAGMGTYCSTHALDFSGTDDVKAYIVSSFKPSTGEVTLTRITDVPANTGIVVKGNADTYTLPWGPGETIVSNMLVGVTENTVLNKVNGDYTNYILAKKSGNLGFYAVSDGSTLSAGKAYLPLPTVSLPSSAGARGMALIFDDETTEIVDVHSKMQNASGIYNLQGQRIENPQKGLHIVNGKKIMIK